MKSTRRSLLQTIPMLAAASAFAVDSPTIGSFIKPYSELPVKQSGQNESRSILNGLVHSGDHLEAHATTLAPGGSPHPPHRHEHEELLLMRSGTLAVTIEGTTGVIGPGGTAFFHSNELHGVRNPGSEIAEYFVVATGV